MTIIHGDLLAVLPTLAADSVDACVTDPPYDYKFMGKAWDGTGIAFDPDTWRAVYRVLKPGAHLVAFGGTRTSHRHRDFILIEKEQDYHDIATRRIASVDPLFSEAVS